MTNEEIDKALKRIDVEIGFRRFNWKRDSDYSVSFTDSVLLSSLISSSLSINSTEFYFEEDTGLPMVKWFQEILDLDPDEMVDMMGFYYQGIDDVLDRWKKGLIMVEVTVDNDMATRFIKKMEKSLSLDLDLV